MTKLCWAVHHSEVRLVWNLESRFWEYREGDPTLAPIATAAKIILDSAQTLASQGERKREASQLTSK